MKLIKDGEKGVRGMKVVGGGIIYLSLHCHHQNETTQRGTAPVYKKPGSVRPA